MSDEYVTLSTKLAMPYRYVAGVIGSKFFTELRDNKKILARRCPECKRVIMPPREYCPKCFSVKTDEWVELSGEGSIESFTIIRYTEPKIQPVEPPYAVGVIKLDGTDGGLTHIIGDVDLDKIEVGMRVKAVFSDERRGNILDIGYFKPI